MIYYIVVAYIKGEVKSLFVYTHRRIGKLIYHYLYDNFDIQLDEKAFTYGCMKPDLPLNRITLKHYKQDSLDSVCEMIRNLKLTSQTLKDESQLKDFSLNLGVIIHFIADFFCVAHNNEAFKELKMHLKYERSLAKKFKKASADDLGIFINLFKNKQLSSLVKVKDYLCESHLEYLNNPSGENTDLKFSLAICFNIALGVFQSSEVSTLVPLTQKSTDAA